ncbi:DUF6460 domain-containing protein [Rhodoplanes roseus]|uniref:DUF6460 domain-containing protein n=1 Tax=Rhodoplanes roseus TaxID=29409 RepID=A0A327KLA6_9BRAD|nr:DUF6460 domain-containing protein [Rhodoplanes roseus]RAI39287.1 hypothetical protein CH341_26160 [Rhodoplanes roseus]
MLHTVVKIAVASLIVGTVLAHFGITLDALTKELGVSPERLEQMVRSAVAVVLPNLLLGALIIVPLWALIYILRPPGQSSE